MGKRVNLVILISAVLLLVSFFKRNTFPEEIILQTELANEPRQEAVKKSPFSVNYKGVNYVVDPKYKYELYGLVVSYRHHDGGSMLHKLWNDHLNMADVCVIWGKTAQSIYLNQFDFWNGQFTCNFRTRSNEAWNSFNQYQISNNHLISDNDYIRDKIKDVKIGDQIRVSGYLSEYGEKGGGKRGTSIVRTDTGNGACETIYVENFEIVEEGHNIWRTLMMVALISLLLSLGVYFVTPHRVSY